MTRLAAVLACLLGAAPAFAQPYDWGGTERFALEMITPRSDHNANHRVYRAYTGLTYEIGIGCIGGVYPYHYELSNAPSGMTVEQTTGVVTWVNPTSTASNITATCRDTKNSTTSQTWSITVGTSGFRFIDATNGSNSGAGGIGAPWQTVAYAKANSGANDIWYFRSGTYLPATNFGSTVNSGSSRFAVEFNSGSEPTIWLAYPGETVTFDFESPEDATTYAVPNVTMGGDTVYWDGFTTTRSAYMVLIRGNGDNTVIRNCRFHRHAYGSFDLTGENAAIFLSEANYDPGTQGYGLYIVDNVFEDSPNDEALKFYSESKSLVERNTFSTMQVGMEWKSDVSQWTVRRNTFTDLAQGDYTQPYAVGGNMDSNTGAGRRQSTGEICFNLIIMPNWASAGEWALDNFGGETGLTAYYRNTILGRINIEDKDADDGPLYFDNNVIQNVDGAESPRAYFYLRNGAAVDNTRIEETNNLKAASGLVDANGLLTGANRTTYCNPVCTRGHELNEDAGGGSPTTPVRLRIRGADAPQ